jgi:hypothetical protein
MSSPKMSIDFPLNPNSGHRNRPSSDCPCYPPQEFGHSIPTHLVLTLLNNRLQYAGSVPAAGKCPPMPIVRVTGPMDHAAKSVTIVHLLLVTRNLSAHRPSSHFRFSSRHEYRLVILTWNMICEHPRLDTFAVA